MRNIGGQTDQIVRSEPVRLPSHANLRFTLQHVQQRIERRTVLAEFLTGIEREERDRAARLLGSTRLTMLASWYVRTPSKGTTFAGSGSMAYLRGRLGEDNTQRLGLRRVRLTGLLDGESRADGADDLVYDDR